MRTPTVLPDIDALPGAELQTAVTDRQRQIMPRQQGPRMRGHVIRTLVVVCVDGIAVGHQALRHTLKIMANARIGILGQTKARAGVLQEKMAQSGSNPRWTGGHQGLHARGETRESAARRFDFDEVLSPHAAKLTSPQPRFRSPNR